MLSMDAVYSNYGTDDAKPIDTLLLDDATAMLRAGELPVGSMGSKIEAAVDFVDTTGNDAYITQPDGILTAIAGEAGTRIVKDAPK